MPSALAKGVFISYSRVNGEIVTIAAKLLRAGGARVFQDVVDIEYGANWQEALASAIRQCERVLLFWSLAAATSEWVEREWRAALAAGKRIVPMLLDTTPLPEELALLHGMPELMDLLMKVPQPRRPADAPLPGEPPEPPAADGFAPAPARAAASPRPAATAPARPASLARRRIRWPGLALGLGTAFCVVLAAGLWMTMPESIDLVAVTAPAAPADTSVPVPASTPASAGAVTPTDADTPAPFGHTTRWSTAVAVLVLLGVVAAWIRRRLVRRAGGGGRPADASDTSAGMATSADAEVTTDPRFVDEIGFAFTQRLFD